MVFDVETADGPPPADWTEGPLPVPLGDGVADNLSAVLTEVLDVLVSPPPATPAPAEPSAPAPAGPSGGRVVQQGWG